MNDYSIQDLEIRHRGRKGFSRLGRTFEGETYLLDSRTGWISAHEPKGI